MIRWTRRLPLSGSCLVQLFYAHTIAVAHFSVLRTVTERKAEEIQTK